jgi:hypothetical protein
LATQRLKIKQILFSMMTLIVINGCSSVPSQKSLVEPVHSKLSEPRYGHTIVNAGDETFVIGGANFFIDRADSQVLLNTVEIIDNKTLETRVASINITPRRYAAAVWDGKDSIFVFGGQTYSSNAAVKVDVININTLEVSHAPDMPLNCHGITAAKIKDDIYISGGSCTKSIFTQKKASSKVHKYSIKEQAWSSVAPLGQGLETKTIALKNKLYAIGGYTGEKAVTDVMQYNPKSNEWVHLPSIPIKTSAHALVARRNKIYVLGDYEDMDRSYEFDVKKQAWKQLNLNFKPVRHSSAVYADKKIILVGGNTGGNGPSHDYIQTIKL